MDRLIGVDGLLVDFDGVIAKTSVESTITFAHQYLDTIAPISKRFVHDYIKCVLCFPVDKSVELLFSSLGLSQYLEGFWREFRCLDADPSRIVIERGFYELGAYCKRRGIELRILSLASEERLKRIHGFDTAWVCPIKGRSKADAATFRALKEQLGMDPSRWVHVDDAPLALRSAKREGFHTVMMLNRVFTRRDYADGRAFIDHRVRSFRGLTRYLG